MSDPLQQEQTKCWEKSAQTREVNGMDFFRTNSIAERTKLSSESVKISESAGASEL